MSHLLQMRGLKLYCYTSFVKQWQVASFTDAWIETFVWTDATAYNLSHLLQMRGLKLR